MEDIGACVFCSKTIREGDKYHSGADEVACADCAPTYADMLAEPSSFRDGQTDEPLTGEQAQDRVDAHIAAGGAVTDKMVSA